MLKIYSKLDSKYCLGYCCCRTRCVSSSILAFSCQATKQHGHRSHAFCTSRGLLFPPVYACVHFAAKKRKQKIHPPNLIQSTAWATAAVVPGVCMSFSILAFSCTRCQATKQNDHLSYLHTSTRLLHLQTRKKVFGYSKDINNHPSWNKLR